MSKEGARKVLVAMSGNMDSSVAAALLKSEGYAVSGVHFRLAGKNLQDGFKARCLQRSNQDSAKAVCAKLDIPFQVLDLEELFLHEVVDYYLHERLQTRKPSPCVFCNEKVKFRALVETAARLGCDSIATGHYAQVSRDHKSGAIRLLRAVDRERDQSALLFLLEPRILDKTLMPLGGIPEALVRKLAVQFGLPTEAGAACATDCVEREPALYDFIEKRTDPVLRLKGIVKNIEGKVVGEHPGLFRYSLGDRKDELEQSEGQSGEDHVIAFDSNPQSLIVGRKELLLRKEVLVRAACWIMPPSGIHGLRCTASVSPRGEGEGCLLTLFENDSVLVQFDTPADGYYPGQAVAFYQGDEVLGGGFVDRWRKPQDQAARKSPI